MTYFAFHYLHVNNIKPHVFTKSTCIVLFLIFTDLTFFLRLASQVATRIYKLKLSFDGISKALVQLSLNSDREDSKIDENCSRTAIRS